MLAVAGVARDAFWVLAVGLLLSVVLMGMGGSSLFPEVLSRTFGPEPGHPALVELTGCYHNLLRMWAEA